MAEHVGQWLYEEGIAYWNGMDFKKKDKKRGRLMVEASASSGFPMAVAFCHYMGWNGTEKDRKKAVAMYVKIEQETKGYHWAQLCLAQCYENGRKGCVQNYTKAFQWYTQSADLGNSDAMNNLGICYEDGQGCVQNMTTAIEWYKKSAQLGCIQAINRNEQLHTSKRRKTEASTGTSDSDSDNDL